jgi:hypothetical protein
MANDTTPAANSPTPAAVSATDSISPSSAGIYGAALTVVALIGLVAFFSVAGSGATDSLGFAALAGVGILSVSLIALIVLSRALGLSTPSAALGLPPGSIRALLALGLAIVFVAVASWTLGGLFDPVGPLVTQVTVPEKTKDAYIQRYPASDYIIGETQVGAAPGNAAGSDGSGLVTLKIYLKRRIDSTVFDLAKQILTISATVLVTIIGFYFGSNSAADAARTVKDTLAAAQSNTDPTDDGSGSNGDQGPPLAPADFQGTAATIASIAAATKSKVQALGDDPLKLLRDAIAGGGADAQLTSAIGSAQDAVSALTAQANAAATDAQRAKDAVASLPSGATAGQNADLGNRLRQLLADANQANQTFEQKLQQFKNAQMSILKKTAKG